MSSENFEIEDLENRILSLLSFLGLEQKSCPGTAKHLHHGPRGRFGCEECFGTRYLTRKISDDEPN